MIAFTQQGISLVVPLTNLQDLLFLQMSLLGAIQTEANTAGQIDGGAVVAPLAELLQATLFNEEQMDEIEAHLQAKASRATIAA